MIWEIIIIIIGVLLVIAGYLLPVKNKEEDDEENEISREQIHEMVSEEMESAKDQISGIVDETISYAIEKTERSMDRLSNEKMMAVNEYSDTVLEQINKSHEEVVFLYDMLNDKHETLKETVAEANKSAAEVKSAIKEAEEFTPIVVNRVQIGDEEPKIVEPAPIYDDAPEPETKPKKTRNSKKPVPIVKAEPLPSPVQEPEEEDDSFFLEEEWEDFGEEDDLVDLEGPEISFHSRTPGSRNSNERILELHKEGKSNMAIAKELGLGVGEVKLVIDLFKGL